MGGVDFNRPRTRAVAHAVLALATSPKGFTASQLTQKVVALGVRGLSSSYAPRHAVRNSAAKSWWRRSGLHTVISPPAKGSAP